MPRRSIQGIQAWLSQGFTPSGMRWYDRRNLPYLLISLTVVLWQSIQAFQYGTSRTYMVQDDARQHVFWMQQWIDPDLFSNDLIADYFRSVAPWGYQSVYQVLVEWQIDPLQAAKILPGLIAAVSTILLFRLMLRLTCSPFIATLGCLFLNQALWLEDGIISATPRAFVYPWLIGFLDGFLTESLVSSSVFMALESLFYPQALLIAIATLFLASIHDLLRQKNRRKTLITFGIGVLILGGLLLGRQLDNGIDFGPILSREMAQTLPELGYVNGEYGRAFFFHRNPVIFWLFSPRSGLLSLGLLNPLLLSAFALPWLLRSRRPLQLSRHLNPQLNRLTYFVGASVLMFVAAHLSLFQLHLPARYTYYSFRVTLVILGAIAMALLLEQWWCSIQSWTRQRQWHWIQVSGALFLVGVITFGWLPLSKGFTVYSHLQIKGRIDEVYAFLRSQPKDILVASLAKEADNIPTFAQRSVLAASEYAIPYHWGYYQQLRQRFQALIAAEYSSDLATIANFIDTYDIDYWLVETWKLSLTEFQKSPRLRQFEPTSGQVMADLEAGKEPILPIFFEGCTAVEQKDQRLLDARCIRTTIAALVQQSQPSQ